MGGVQRVNLKNPGEKGAKLEGSKEFPRLLYGIIKVGFSVIQPQSVVFRVSSPLLES